MKVAIYARKSQENEDAVTRQISLAREFAEHSGFVVVQEFTDDGISGAEFVDRPGLAALMVAVKAGEFSGVITMNVDRFGREAYRTNLVMLEIVEAGCRIYTYQDGQEVKLDTPIAKQMISMRNYAAEDFNANISAKTHAALLLKARAGHATGTRTYGYDLVRVGEGKSSHVERSINQAEADVVVKVFTLAAKGLGNGRIVNVRNEEHAPAPGKHGWQKTTVRTVLSNRLYIGEVVFGRSRPAVSGGRAKKRAVIKDESKWTVVSLPDLRIVSAALWTQVQARRAASLERFAPHRADNGKLNGRPEAGLIAGHLLNGFLICGVCGGSMGFTSKNGYTRAYYCMRRRSYGKVACSNARGVPEDKLDSAVLGSLHKLVKDPETMWALVQERTERWRREQALTVDTRRNLEREEKKLVKKIENLTAAIEDGQPVGNALKQRQAELDVCRARLAADGVVGQTDEEAFERMLLERAEQLRKHHGPVLGGYAKSHPQTRDNAQTRAAMRTLGVDRITVTPNESGWTFVGDGNLTGLVQGGERVARRSPRFPPTVVSVRHGDCVMGQALRLDEGLSARRRSLASAGMAANCSFDSFSQKIPAGLGRRRCVRMTRSGVTMRSSGTSCSVMGIASSSTCSSWTVVTTGVSSSTRRGSARTRGRCSLRPCPAARPWDAPRRCRPRSDRSPRSHWAPPARRAPSRP